MSTSTKRAIRVLFVDDDLAARTGYLEFLSRHAFDVRTAATGHDALMVATDWLPDVIVLDLGLPDIDGWEVARRLKAGGSTRRVPIIALTAADLPHERVSAMRAGCDRHIAKPCAPADVLDAIRRCLDAASS